MKYQTNRIEPVQNSQDILTREVKINANAKAFQLLFGQIYPDIKRAIVRELFANAWDSQKTAGNLDKPIDVHIPTSWEPSFSIRDYGTGMSPKTIEKVYCHLFESTKDSMNDQVGMFGIGSKTPLGYTNTFSVTSYYNQMMYVYNVFVDDDGKPQLALKVEQPTSQPSGIFVSLGVKEQDINSFEKYALALVSTIRTPVNINKSDKKSRYTTLLSGENWEITKGLDEMLYIRMGCILYKVEYHHSIVRSKSIAKLMHSNYSIIIDCDIGDVDITGSREDIIYNEKAGKLLEERGNQLKEQLPVISAAIIQKQDTLYNKILIYQRLTSELPWSIRSFISGNFFKGDLSNNKPDESLLPHYDLKKYNQINNVRFVNTEKMSHYSSSDFNGLFRKSQMDGSTYAIFLSDISSGWNIKYKDEDVIIGVVQSKITNKLAKIAAFKNMCADNNVMIINLNQNIKSDQFVLPNFVLEFLPKNYKIINIDDIPVEKVVDKSTSVSSDNNLKLIYQQIFYTSSRLEDCLYNSDDDRNKSHKNNSFKDYVARNDFYTDYKKSDKQSTDKINLVCSILHLNKIISIPQVARVSQSKEYLIELYDMKKIEDVYEKYFKKTTEQLEELIPLEAHLINVSQSLLNDYISDESGRHNKIVNKFLRCLNQSSVYYDSEMEEIGRLIGFDSEIIKRYLWTTFSCPLIGSVNKRKIVKEKVDNFRDQLRQLFTKHEILDFVSDRTLIYNYSNIRKTLGEQQ